MSRNTMGEFLQALRKANGLTQKELADKLNVTDKAISRWERDESYPDLTLIPILADIYHVSSDEILRGEKATDAVSKPESVMVRTEKQLSYLVKKQKSTFFARTLIAIGVLIAGILSAFICNAVNRGFIGFLVAAVLISTAIILEIVFISLSLSAASAENFEEDTQNALRKSIFTVGARTIMTALLSLIFLSPLTLLHSYLNMGIVLKDFIKNGCIFLLLGFIPTYILYRISLVIAIKKKIFAKRKHTPIAFKKAYKTYLVIFLVVAIAIGSLQYLFPAIAHQNHLFLKTRDFDDRRVFLYYLERTNSHIESYPYAEPLYDKDGKVVLHYVLRAHEVGEIWVEGKDGKYLYRTATHTALQKQEQILSHWNIAFCTLYGADLLAVLLYAIIKQSQYKKLLKNEKESAA